MKVLITGANGMLARAAIDYCNGVGDAVAGVTRQELDIADAIAVNQMFEREHPDAILNCAAYTDVDGSESNEEQAFAANSTGVENLALGARRINAAFVTVSTDYVFDGTKTGFYTQRDDPNPTGVYAKSKRAGEIRAQTNYARSIIVRSGLIFGAGGTNFLSKMPELLFAGKTIKAISDSYGTPTYAPDLARRLRELAELDLPGIYHVTNAGEGASFEDFARQIPDINSEQITSVSATALKRPAPRPMNSRLRCLLSPAIGLAPLPHWTDALNEYVIVVRQNQANTVSNAS